MYVCVCMFPIQPLTPLIFIYLASCVDDLLSLPRYNNKFQWSTLNCRGDNNFAFSMMAMVMMMMLLFLHGLALFCQLSPQLTRP